MSLPGRQYRGEVSRVGSAAIVQNSSSGEVVNVPITVRLLKNEPDLKIGYTVDMTINTMQMSKVLTIPVEALADRGGKTVVYVMKNNVLQEREVKTKSGNELFDVVVSGLKAANSCA
jgi:HlyD family secretion protein